MVSTGFKTEKNAAGKVLGWFWIDTTINEDIIRTERRTYLGSNYVLRTSDTTPIYCHQDAATEPVTDGNIKFTTFDDSETIYTGSGGYIKSFTSETSFFSSNQNFDASPIAWTIYWNGKVTGISPGYQGYIKFEFYKRNTSNVDTLLFSADTSCPGFYSVSGNTLNVVPAGSVTTADRLRIRVEMGERLPV